MAAHRTLPQLIVASAVVGALAGLAAVAVRQLLDVGLHLLYGADNVVAAVAGLSTFWRIAAPALGGAAAGLIASLVARGAGHGVADVMEAVALGRGRIPLLPAVVKALGSIAAALGGGSIGREGPIIQLGAGVGTLIGEKASDSSKHRRALIAAGTAAGFAAAYNTPLAAMLFVLEIVIGVVTLDVLIPVAVAVTVGTAITRVLAGGGPIYGLRDFALASPAEYLAFVVLGLVAAVVGVGFMKLLSLGEHTFNRMHRVPRVARAAFGGLLVGLVLWHLPAVAGNGFEPVRGILDGAWPIGALLVLAAAKAFATTASVASGSPGGVFTPTMLLGAAVGAAAAAVVARVAPFGDQVVPGGYALVGMAAVVAATTHAPLMASVLVFEISGDYAIVLPLLLATAVATLLARVLAPDSLYSAELRRKGVAWGGTLTERLARAARARDLMEHDPEVVGASEPLELALGKLAAGRGRLIYVVDDGPLRAISLTAAKTVWARCMRGENGVAGMTAGELATAVATAAPDDSLLELGEKLWNVDWGELPVVDPANPRVPIGTVTRRALLGAFDRELIQRDVLLTRVVWSEGHRESVDYLELPDGHRVEVVAAPTWMWGTAPDVGLLRTRFGVTLVAVRSDGGGESLARWHDVDPARPIRQGDRWMVIATEAELARLRAAPLIQAAGKPAD